MIIFLYGPDDYRRLEKQNFYVQEFAKKHAASGIGFFDCSEQEGVDHLREFVRNQSMFDPVRLCVVRNAFSAGEGELKEIVEPLGRAERIHFLISEEKKPVKKLEFLMKNASVTKEFPKLTGATWRAFVKKEAERRHVPCTSEAIRLLADAYEGDTWGLVTELEKAAGLKKEIGGSELGELGVEVAPDYWRLVNGLRGSDTKKKLAALQELLLRGEPGAKIFNILAALWTQNAPAFAGYDVAIKTGKMDYEEALLDVALA